MIPERAVHILLYYSLKVPKYPPENFLSKVKTQFLDSPEYLSSIHPMQF